MFKPIRDTEFSKDEDSLYENRKQLKLKKKEILMGTKISDENIFVNLLTKKRVNKSLKMKSNVHREVIRHDITIKSNQFSEIPQKKYYKFPFNHFTPIDTNFSTYNMLDEWKTAYKSIYENFKAINNTFFMIFQGTQMRYENYKIYADHKISQFLIESGIDFNQNNVNIMVEGFDADLLFDACLNFQFNSEDSIPFLISKIEFENSIMFYTKVIQKPAISVKGKTVFMAHISGYFLNFDYEEYYTKLI